MTSAALLIRILHKFLNNSVFFSFFLARKSDTICVSDRNYSKMTNYSGWNSGEKSRLHLNYSIILIGILTGILLGKTGLTRPSLYHCPWFRFIVCLGFKWNLRWRERWNVYFSLQKGAGVAFQSSPCGSFPLYVFKNLRSEF